MAKINEEKLKQELKAGVIKNFYFIFGEEKYMVEYYTNKIISSTLKDNINDFNFSSFSFNTLNLDKLADSIEAISFMSPMKCVKVVNLDIEKLSIDELKRMKNIISDLPNTTVFIISQTAIDINVKKSSKWQSFIKACEKSGNVIECQKLNKSALVRQISNWTNKLGSKISIDVANYLVDSCSDNLLELKNEIQKLSSFKYGNSITKNDIDKIVTKRLEANIFELSKLILKNNAIEAINNLNILLYNKEEPIAILSILAALFIDIYRIKTAELCRQYIDVLPKYFNYKGKEFRLSIASRYCKNITIDKIIKCIEILTETDAKLKSLKIDNEILMNELIGRLIFEIHR